MRFQWISLKGTMIYRSFFFGAERKAIAASYMKCIFIPFILWKGCRNTLKLSVVKL